MPIKTYNQMSFTQYHVEKRKIKAVFFQQIDQIIDWRKITNILNKYYIKGQDVTGREAYPSLLLFKMSLLQTWYNLSDYEVEDCVKDRLSFMRFCGLRLEDDVPDHSVLSRFRSELTKNNAYGKLLKAFNKQLEKHKVIVKQSVIVDASVTASLRCAGGTKLYALSSTKNEKKDPFDTRLGGSGSKKASLDGCCDDFLREQKEKNVSDTAVGPQAGDRIKRVIKAGVDQEGSWHKKHTGGWRYGYKRHYVVDKDSSIVLGVETTGASTHESLYLGLTLATADLSRGTEVQADKGYYGAPNAKLLRDLGFKNRIQGKAVRGRPLCYWSKQRNKLISKTRYKVERVFGSIKRWFGGGTCRYIGKAKTHSQHVLEALSYNLYISPRLIMSKGI